MLYIFEIIEGRPGLDPEVEDGVNPAIFFLATNLSKGCVYVDKLTTSHTASYPAHFTSNSDLSWKPMCTLGVVHFWWSQDLNILFIEI